MSLNIWSYFAFYVTTVEGNVKRTIEQEEIALHLAWQLWVGVADWHAHCHNHISTAPVFAALSPRFSINPIVVTCVHIRKKKKI